jgi:hypothetical protein
MRALGPETALILLMVSLIVTVDPREAFMPFVVNALKMNDLRGVQLARVALLCAVAVAVGLAVAVPVTTYLQYSHGAPWHDGWACDAVATGPFRETLSNTQRLQAQGVLDEARSVSGLGRFAAASLPKPAFLIALAAGLGAFLLFSLARLRFARWPVHPVMFLVWVTYPAKMFAFSFLIGWMAKGLVMKYGGARVYQGLKSLMIGLIAGEILGGVVPMLIGFALSLLGRPDLAPPQFGIMPH